MTDAEQPTRRSGILYVDTSALLKLIVREAESKVIEAELLQWEDIATSVVTEIELPRAVARAREDRPDNVIDGSVVLQSVITAAMIVPLDPGIISKALNVKPIHVGTLDAIHIGSASSLRPELAAVATYDKRMQRALALMEIEVLTPSGNAKLSPPGELEPTQDKPS